MPEARSKKQEAGSKKQGSKEREGAHLSAQQGVTTSRGYLVSKESSSDKEAVQAAPG
jgi:hypothetical protein